MKKLLYTCLVTITVTLLPLTACQTEGETNSTAIIESADDIVFTPGDCAYRTNVHQQGVENPWLPVKTVEVALGEDDNTAYVRYRDYIVTIAGETRNNIIDIRTPVAFVVGNINLEINNLSDGIEITRRDQNCGRPGNYKEVLAIEISPDVQPGEYTFEIDVAIEDIDYGTLTCTLNIVEGMFNVLFLTSAQEVTLKEASEMVGVDFPTPSYFPVDYEVKKIFIYKSEITLLISDKSLEEKPVTKTYSSKTFEYNQYQCRMEITIRWIDDGFYIPPHKVPGKVVNIKDNWAKLTPSNNNYRLWLYYKPNVDDPGVFEFVITANRTISENEIIKIAESFNCF